MYGNLTIDGDPTIWVLAKPVDASPLFTPGETYSVQVTSPLYGTLLLNRKAASNVAIFNSTASEGNASSDPNYATPVLYLPSSTGLNGRLPVYALPSATNLTQLAAGITAAMSNGTLYTIAFGGAESGGVLVLNGGALPFVVLCPAGGILNQPSGGGGVGPSD